MSETRYKILFIDIDGTLVGRENTLSPANIKALHSALEMGVTIVLTTGRNPCMAEDIIETIGCNGYGIFNNGAVILDGCSGNPSIVKVPLDKDTVRQSVDIALAHNTAPMCFGAKTEIDGGNAIYTVQGLPVFDEFELCNATRIQYLPVTELYDLSPTIIEVFGDEIKVHSVADEWSRNIANISVHTMKLTLYDCWSTHMNSSEISKAKAAQYVCDKLGIPSDKAMAIGDSVNDIELFQWAGLGICMGDGPEEAQNAADEVTRSFSDDGVAYAINRYILSNHE